MDHADRTRRLRDRCRVRRAVQGAAANQGLYNGFLVAGLVWGLVADDTDVLLFFTGCVVVAGVYGAATVNRRILLVQALPGLLAFRAVLAPLTLDTPNQRRHGSTPVTSTR